MKICHIFTLTVDTTSEMLSVNMKIFISMFLLKKFHENRMILPETRKYFFFWWGEGGGGGGFLPSFSFQLKLALLALCTTCIFK